MVLVEIAIHLLSGAHKTAFLEAANWLHLRRDIHAARTLAPANCGSKVFFDSLGAPWPEHCCRALRSRSPDARDEDRDPFVELVGAPFDPRLQLWRDRIDEQVAIRARQKRTGQQDPIVAVAPRRGVPREVLGVVREPFVPADPFKSFGLLNTTMAQAMLGPLGRGPVARGTVHLPTADGNEIESYAIWIRLPANGRSPFRDSTVTGTVRMISAGKDHVWWSDDLVLFTRRATESESIDG